MANQIGLPLVRTIASQLECLSLQEIHLDRILTPAFSPGSIKGMFDDMFDICSQLVLKWERYADRF
jgi:hypothetical protein